MTYSELFEYSVNKLNSAGITEAESDARLLFFYLLDADRSFMFMNGREEVPEGKIQKIHDALKLREERIPLQHITGWQNFMGLEFMVSPDVLIPRFDTETLVEEAMLVCQDGDKVLDVCTGSGCILISLMKYKNNLQGFGCDISEAALEIARKNGLRLLEYEESAEPSGPDCYDDMVNVSEKSKTGKNEIELCKPKCDDNNPKLCNSNRDNNDTKLCKSHFIKSDLFENIEEKDFDIIVSNPPYIRSAVIPTLMPEVRDHDPMLALDGGEDGLIFYRRIAADGRNYLKKGGSLLVEIGHDQGREVSDIFIENGYSKVQVIKDLAGNDRVVRGMNLCLTD